MSFLAKFYKPTWQLFLPFKSTGYPTRDAAEAMMVRAMVNGSPLCASVGDGIRLYCNADAFLAEEPKNQADLAGQFFFVGSHRV